MQIWNQEKYIKAWHFASIAHNGQTVPGSDIPYIHHIGLVAMEAMTAVYHTQMNSPDLLIQCSLLHDTIEDTGTEYDDIKEEFGFEVANGVMALSKTPDVATKQEQIMDSLKRIKREPEEIWMVKLADRITNLQPPPKHWNKNKISRYRDEAKLILDALQGASDYLAARLLKKIDEYAQYE